jgi:hypothetical protein
VDYILPHLVPDSLPSLPQVSYNYLLGVPVIWGFVALLGAVLEVHWRVISVSMRFWISYCPQVHGLGFHVLVLKLKPTLKHQFVIALESHFSEHEILDFILSSGAWVGVSCPCT